MYINKICIAYSGGEMKIDVYGLISYREKWKIVLNKRRRSKKSKIQMIFITSEKHHI